jgi:hypothetical protein
MVKQTIQPIEMPCQECVRFEGEEKGEGWMVVNAKTVIPFQQARLQQYLATLLTAKITINSSHNHHND